MERFKQLNKFTRTVLILAFTLVLYGYLCRQIGLYFFWESRSIGWALLFIGVIGLLVDSIKKKEKENKKAVMEKIVIGIIAFYLLIQAVLLIIIPSADAYSVAKTAITNDPGMQSELGSINGFGLIPTGSIQKSTDASGKSGNATINLTVKGENKYKDVSVHIVKDANSPDWQVVQIE